MGDQAARWFSDDELREMHWERHGLARDGSLG
jgi:hypothetical protein